MTNLNLPGFEPVAKPKKHAVSPLEIGARVVRRSTSGRRLVASAVGNAAQVLGVIGPGEEISGVTNGQFSLIDVVEHLLVQSGPARVTISTWTMGIYDEEQAVRFCADGRIENIRFLVDPSMFSRRPELSGRLVQAFGVDAFRAVNTHAKFATIRGEGAAFAIRSSMNLNPNRRLESFDIANDDAFCSFFERIADDVFDRYDPPDADGNTQSTAAFADILAKFESLEAEKPEAPKRAWRAANWKSGWGAA